MFLKRCPTASTSPGTPNATSWKRSLTVDHRLVDLRLTAQHAHRPVTFELFGVRFEQSNSITWHGARGRYTRGLLVRYEYTLTVLMYFNNFVIQNSDTLHHLKTEPKGPGESTLDWLIIHPDLTSPNWTHLTHFGMQNKCEDPDTMCSFLFILGLN